jgi:hypothetical protein
VREKERERESNHILSILCAIAENEKSQFEIGKPQNRHFICTGVLYEVFCVAAIILFYAMPHPLSLYVDFVFLCLSITLNGKKNTKQYNAIQ